jgi:hypothetical protein
MSIATWWSLYFWVALSLEALIGVAILQYQSIISFVLVVIKRYMEKKIMKILLIWTLAKVDVNESPIGS